MTSPRNRKSWPAESIRRARQAPLKPLLEQLGYRLDPLENDNWKTYGLPREIVIKEHYWSCPENGTGGNAIDLLVQVIGMPFSEAMERLEGST